MHASRAGGRILHRLTEMKGTSEHRVGRCARRKGHRSPLPLAVFRHDCGGWGTTKFWNQESKNIIHHHRFRLSLSLLSGDSKTSTSHRLSALLNFVPVQFVLESV